MSALFRMKYFFGMVPSAEKIDADWAKLLKMQDELRELESSSEILRFYELDNLINSFEFQFHKKEIIDLAFSGSNEESLILERNKLEKSSSIKNYFKLLNSSELIRFQKAEQSNELKRFKNLKEEVDSESFQNRKKEIESLSWKGSPEYRMKHEYLTLSNSRKLKKYHKTVNSREYLWFKEFHSQIRHDGEEQISGKRKPDKNLKRYQRFHLSGKYANVKTVEKEGLAFRTEELKKQINSGPFLEKEAYLKNRYRYKTTPDYPVLEEYLKLSRDKEILFYQKFKNSPLYLNFINVADSYDLGRLKELRQVTSEKEFLEKVAYLKNKKRYQTTDYYNQELEHAKLDKSSSLRKYRLLKNSPALEFFKKWNLAFSENFDGNKLDNSHWQSENYLNYKLSGRSFSQADEAQGYNGENNLVLSNKSLSIIAKREQMKGQLWDIATGLIPKEFKYSSGIINSADGFRFTEGIIETKVKFAADQSITNAFSLTGSKPFPQIDLFRSGRNSVGLGYTELNGNGPLRQYKQIHGLNFEKYHVFRLEKFDHILVWKINGIQVHSTTFNHSLDEMFFNLLTSLHEPVNNKLLPHSYKIDWIRCYTKVHSN